MEARELTSYRLAQLSGLTQQHIGKVLLGKRDATDDVIERLAPFLEVSPTELKARAALDRLAPDVRDYLLTHARELLQEAAAELPRVVPLARGRRPGSGDRVGAEAPGTYRTVRAAASRQGVISVDPDREEHDELDSPFTDET